jgi:iron(III) transport system ATP-binding protein
MTATSELPAAKARNHDMGEPVVEVRGVNKSFHRRDGSVVTAARDTTFTVGDGEILVLLGPSGCGKTTLLRTIAGLEMPDTGEIRIGGREVFSDQRKIRIPPERRDIGMMFQSYALWPHMTVRRNVAYPLECARVRKAQRRERVDHALERVGIGHLADQYPGQMSGGQQQRVALARAIVGDARLVLFDEPLSNIDAKERERLRAELKQMQRNIGFSAVYVTHDQSEALALGDRVALIRDGAIEQLATPRELYQRPANRGVAGFIGTMNEIAGTVSAVDADGTVRVTTPLGTVRGQPSDAAATLGAAVLALIRPERIRLATGAAAHRNSWRARVASRAFMGARNEYTVELGGQLLDVWAQDRWDEEPRGETWVEVLPEDVLVVPKPD